VGVLWEQRDRTTTEKKARKERRAKKKKGERIGFSRREVKNYVKNINPKN